MEARLSCITCNLPWTVPDQQVCFQPPLRDGQTDDDESYLHFVKNQYITLSLDPSQSTEPQGVLVDMS